MIRKKSLGQHFLQTKHYLALVAESAYIEPGETILEIGPGEGALTQELLARRGHVVAIEKDHRLIAVLEETFTSEIAEGKLLLQEADALTISPEDLGFVGGAYKIVANIPYYITGALLKKFLTDNVQPSSIVFLIQKEVAERIARSKKESILSLSVKAYGEPTYIKTVPAGAFSPPPEVDSAILLIKNISRERFVSPEHEEKFFTVLHAAFAQKRKLLKRNIERIFGEQTVAALTRAGIPENARAEDVAIEQWLLLTSV